MQTMDKDLAFLGPQICKNPGRELPGVSFHNALSMNQLIYLVHIAISPLSSVSALTLLEKRHNDDG